MKCDKAYLTVINYLEDRLLEYYTDKENCDYISDTEDWIILSRVYDAYSDVYQFMKKLQRENR